MAVLKTGAERGALRKNQPIIVHGMPKKFSVWVIIRLLTSLIVRQTGIVVVM
jgi:hypothetical protein